MLLSYRAAAEFKRDLSRNFFLSKYEEIADRTVFRSHMIKMLLAGEIEESSKKHVGDWCDCSLHAGIYVCFSQCKKSNDENETFQNPEHHLNDRELFHNIGLLQELHDFRI